MRVDGRVSGSISHPGRRLASLPTSALPEPGSRHTGRSLLSSAPGLSAGVGRLVRAGGQGRPSEREPGAWQGQAGASGAAQTSPPRSGRALGERLPSSYRLVSSAIPRREMPQLAWSTGHLASPSQVQALLLKTLNVPDWERVGVGIGEKADGEGVSGRP